MEGRPGILGLEREEGLVHNMDKIAPYWKAVVAFIAPGVVSIASAVTESSAGGTSITSAEWITAVCAALIAAAAVYATPNKPQEPVNYGPPV
jgi:hypothetical protein